MVAPSFVVVSTIASSQSTHTHARTHGQTLPAARAAKGEGKGEGRGVAGRWSQVAACYWLPGSWPIAKAGVINLR